MLTSHMLSLNIGAVDLYWSDNLSFGVVVILASFYVRGTGG